MPNDTLFDIKILMSKYHYFFSFIFRNLHTLITNYTQITNDTLFDITILISKVHHSFST